MVVEHMEEVFGATPYQWQKEVTTHLALMNLPDSGVRSGPVLLVRPTGGGKSSVRDVHGIINGGVSLTITPLLSLGSDQEEKLWSRPNASAGNIVPIHLDEIRSPLEQQNIIEGIKDLPDRHTTVFLFSSPQALVNNNSCWLPLIHWLIDKGRLSMVCVDEVHLFVHFGLTFRKEFQQLTPMLFSKLRIGRSKLRTKVPLLFMTATCTQFIVGRIEALLDIRFLLRHNVFWPNADGMQHRQVFLEVQYSSQPLAVFKSKVGPLLESSTVDKFILYSNNRTTVDRQVPKLADWIDTTGKFKADLLKIVGSLLREQKFYHTRVFTTSNYPNKEVLEECREEDRPFNPQILVATSGAANAGLDDSEVHGVARLEFPPSCLDVKQEKGRAGRRPNAGPEDDWYLLCLSLETYVVLIKRLHDTTPAVKKTEYFKSQERDMQDTLELFVIPLHCIQASLEMTLANPYLFLPARPVSCDEACTFCTGGYKKLFPKLDKSGVTSIVLDIFVGQNAMQVPAVLDKALVDALKAYPGSNRLLFGTNSEKKPEPVMVKKMILMLLAARILTYSVITKESTDKQQKSTVTVVASLAFLPGEPTKLAICEDSYWRRLPQRPD
jgi:hypothetical protein